VIGRRALAGLAAIVVLGGVGAYLGIRSAGGGSITRGGPLAPPRDANFFGVGSPTDPGKPWSFGLLVASNRGTAAATLDRVELRDADGQVREIGAYVQPKFDRHAVGLLPGFPPGDPSPSRRPLTGYTLAPGRGVRVIVGLLIDRIGRYRFHALRLYYRVGDRRYLADWPLAVQFCAPEKRYFGRCPAPS
jgi:hypothetical protein